MILKKKKAVIAAIVSAAMAISAAMPVAVSAAGVRTKAEKYGDDTYAKRFLSLYDDVVTNGQETGYLSKNNVAAGGFGAPYHAIEELIVEAPDYGHETTSEAMSYIVWMAAMRDAISKDGTITNPDGSTEAVDKTSDLAKAWKTMELMIPTVQNGFWSQSELSAQYAEEHEDPETYPTDQNPGNTGKNPIHSQYSSLYRGDKGLYLMHWLADVDDWYGYGGGNGKFTFINTFQRGAQESCWETVPHGCIEELKYGEKGTRGIKGIFSTEDTISPQWAYTNAPDAEDRAIQGVYLANRNGVGDANVTSLAGKMGDQLRNNMFDKYYKKIGVCNASDQSGNGANNYAGAHYLMSWYTSWGGDMGGQWAWQIGASHCHEFYQNPLAAYALLTDADLKKGMLTGAQAVKDYETSLQRQLEFYLWLQSSDGPIAGGATSSWNGRYEAYKYNESDTAKYGTSTPAMFYNMGYVEHPVYLDPGSNHWIGNQVWAVQRLAEMYYIIKTEGDKLNIKAGGLTTEEALKAILDRWVDWFIQNTKLEDDGTFAIPASLDWFGQPADWNGKYDPNANKGLTCEITAYGSSDLGCVSSLAHTLIYYAKANGVETEAAYSSENTDLAAKGLYLAHSLLDREWNLGRDDWGLSIAETNGSMWRLFEQEIWIPNGQDGIEVDGVKKFQNKIKYDGTMPNGERIVNGIKFLDIRQKYLTQEDKGTYDNGYVKKFQAAYDQAIATGSNVSEAMETVELNYHRFWHAGDILMALGTMYQLYPDMEADKYNDSEEDELVVTPSKVVLGVGDSETIKATINGEEVVIDSMTSDSDAVKVEGNKIIAVEKTETPAKVTVTVGDLTATVTVTVKEEGDIKDAHWGDVDCNGEVEVNDIVALNMYLLDVEANIPSVTAQGLINANCEYDDVVDLADAAKIINYLAELIPYEDLGPQS